MGELLLRLVGGVPWLLWCLSASSGCTARGWGATGGGLGVLRVGGAFVQYAQPLVSGSRPSWSRPTRGRSRAEPTRCGQNRRRTMTSGPLRRRRSGGGGGPVAEALGSTTKNPGLAPTRPGVHSADINEPAAKAPRGDRWNPAVPPRRAAPMRLRCQHHGHQRPARTRQTSSLRASPPPGPPARPGLPPERVPQKP